METVYNKIENGNIVNSIVASADFIATQQGAWELQINQPVELPTEEEKSREWRDQELKFTDNIILITDHSQHSNYITYRAALRDWPSTSDFPDTKPTLQ